MKSIKLYDSFVDEQENKCSKADNSKQINENTQSYNTWKRNNVTLRGIKTPGQENNVWGSFGKGLYTVPLSNKSMAKQYGQVYFVVNAKPKNPKIVSDLNLAEIFMHKLKLDYYRRYHENADTDDFSNYDKSRKYFDNNTTIEDEMINLGYDGFVIKGREMVNYKPKDVLYFKDENQLKNYYYTLSLYENSNSLNIIKQYESFRTEQEIIDLCSEYDIENYQIIDDGSIDVGEDVLLGSILGDLKQLPLTFNEVIGLFSCRENNLTTLEGCPKKVGRNFKCSWNRLTSLEHSPKIVGGDFYCGGNGHLTSLEGLENTYITGDLYVNKCIDLYSIKGFPKKVGGFICDNTPIKPIYDTFIKECDYDTMRKFNKFDVIYTDGLDWFIDYDNLGKFLRSVGKEDLMMSKEKFNDFIQTTKYRWDY
jgi:hypothetical protein